MRTGAAAVRSGACSSAARARRGRQRGADCESRGAPRRGAVREAAGPGSSAPGRMSRQAGRGTESKKMVTAAPRSLSGRARPGDRRARARGGGCRRRRRPELAGGGAGPDRARPPLGRAAASSRVGSAGPAPPPAPPALPGRCRGTPAAPSRGRFGLGRPGPAAALPELRAARGGPGRAGGPGRVTGTHRQDAKLLSRPSNPIPRYQPGWTEERDEEPNCRTAASAWVQTVRINSFLVLYQYLKANNKDKTVFSPHLAMRTGWFGLSGGSRFAPAPQGIQLLRYSDFYLTNLYHFISILTSFSHRTVL